MSTKLIQNLTSLNKSFINGKWIDGDSGRSYDILNPYDSSVITSVPLASLKQVRESFKAAKEAQREWANSTEEERKGVLRKVAEYLNNNQEEIINVIVQETGGTLLKAGFERHLSEVYVKESLNFADAIDKVKEVPSDVEGKVNYIHRLPVGVVSSISPFNLPLILSLRTIASAIALGNSVVHKPDIQVGITGGSIIARAFEYAGLPAGVLNIVQTDIPEIGDEMLTNSNLDLISFTGSSAVGRHIGGIAGQNLKRVALELGGNSPFVALSDADIDRAVDAAIFGKFMFNGQICMAINRFIVHENKYDEFVDKFIERAKKLPYGDPKEKDTIIGPIINKDQFEKAKNIIEEATRSDMKVALEGKVVGNIITPYVFSDVDNSSNLAQTEVFAPIASMIKAKSDEEAIQLANDTEYGLSSALFTQDLEKDKKYALEIDSGMTHINDQTINDSPIVPFRGNKASGLGRFGNPWIIEEFTVPKWVSAQQTYRKFPF